MKWIFGHGQRAQMRDGCFELQTNDVTETQLRPSVKCSSKHFHFQLPPFFLSLLISMMEPAEELEIYFVEDNVHEARFGGYDFVFVDELSPGQTCSICLLAMRNPVQTTCGHRFCGDCLVGTFRCHVLSYACSLYMKNVFLRLITGVWSVTQVLYALIRFPYEAIWNNWGSLPLVQIKILGKHRGMKCYTSVICTYLLTL